ncbi:hypothetical protein D9757_011355 [Collybiopsis confluens]|uniref:Uncharacterized protein n=1 Tax=Collybiopsis confluens TaxID=2823264 RepID=A0A8H5LL80_9AGAR|nr:hypothetical protein D9757_011355 [Collybiopsis confluens]
MDSGMSTTATVNTTMPRSKSVGVPSRKPYEMGGKELDRNGWSHVYKRCLRQLPEREGRACSPLIPSLFGDMHGNNSRGVLGGNASPWYANEGPDPAPEVDKIKVVLWLGRNSQLRSVRRLNNNIKLLASNFFSIHGYTDDERCCYVDFEDITTMSQADDGAA